jgi:hypothetical protein
MTLTEQYRNETGKSHNVTEGKYTVLNNLGTREYIKWLENKLQNTSSNSDYAKCIDEIMETFFPNSPGVMRKAVEEIFRKHFAYSQDVV